MTGVSLLLLMGLSACGGGSAGAGGAPATGSAPVTVVPAAPTPSPSPAAQPTPLPAPAPPVAATPAPVETPVAVPAPAPTAASGAEGAVVFSEGDSISMYWGGAHTGIFARTHPTAEFHGNAVGGARISDPVGGNGLVQRLAALRAAHPQVVTVLIGANDLGDGQYETTQAWLDALWSYVAQVKAGTGAKVALGTLLPICIPSMAYYTDRHAERRTVVNAAIRAAVGTRIDAVYDLAADPVMGPDAAACDRTLYKDGLHPTDGDTGGQGRIAAIYSRTVDALLNR